MSRGNSALRARHNASCDRLHSLTKLTTWPIACTPASVRPLATTRCDSPVMRCEGRFEGGLQGGPLGLKLPAGVGGAVVRQGQFESPHRQLACRRRSPSKFCCRRRAAAAAACRRAKQEGGAWKNSSNRRLLCDQQLGDLHGIGRGPFAQIVADAPEGQAVRTRQVFANPADEDFVAVRCN